MERLAIDMKQREREDCQQRISESADQRERAEEALLELARSGHRNPTLALALMEKVRAESLRIRRLREELAGYEMEVPIYRKNGLR